MTVSPPFSPDRVTHGARHGLMCDKWPKSPGEREDKA